MFQPIIEFDASTALLYCTVLCTARFQCRRRLAFCKKWLADIFHHNITVPILHHVPCTLTKRSLLDDLTKNMVIRSSYVFSTVLPTVYSIVRCYDSHVLSLSTTSHLIAACLPHERNLKRGERKKEKEWPFLFLFLILPPSYITAGKALFKNERRVHRT